MNEKEKAMKLRALFLVLGMLVLGGVVSSMTACSEEEAPPMKNAPTDPDYNKSDKDG